MKVLAIVCLTFGVVFAGRSGPYLPSGWKPSGPAFLLPGEVEKPSDNPLKETIQVEAEGSDALREYGPPKTQEESQELTKQDLPDVIIETSFAEVKSNDIIESDIREVFEVVTEVIEDKVVEDKVIENKAVDDKSVEDKTLEDKAVEDATTVLVEVVTEKNAQETQSDELIEVRANTEAVDEATEKVTESSVVEKAEIVEAVQENENANSNIVSAVEEREEKTVVDVEEREGKSVDAEVSQVETAAQGVKNIEEALVNLENEIKSKQAKSVESIVEIKTSQQDTANLQQAPEGFLEYGPPGFREYGPPKDFLRSGNVEEEAVETNETRRRRFSPKVRLVKQVKH